MQLKRGTRRSTAVRRTAAHRMGHAARGGHPRHGVAAAGRLLWIACMLMPALLLRGEPWVLQSTGLESSLKATDFVTRCVCCRAAVGYQAPHSACSHPSRATALQRLWCRSRAHHRVGSECVLCKAISLPHAWPPRPCHLTCVRRLTLDGLSGACVQRQPHGRSGAGLGGGRAQHSAVHK